MAEDTQGTALAGLRQRLALIERGGRAALPVLPFGVKAIDAALPGGGLARGVLHEVEGRGAAAEEGAEAAGFLAAILARLEPGRRVLWCCARADLHAPGLAMHGLAPARLVLVRAAERALLWAMEEGLKCSDLAAVVGEIGTLPDLAGRRLQLAAEASGVTAFVLRRRAAPAADEPSAAVTRWRIAAAAGGRAHPAEGMGQALWQVELRRCRGGVPGQWRVEAGDAAGHVHLAQILADRPAAPERRRAAG
jgi:protein ImuA